MLVRRTALLVFPTMCLGIFCSACVKRVPPSKLGNSSVPQESRTPTAGKAIPDPTIAVFEVEPSIIQTGEEAVIRWKTRNTASVEVSQGIGRVEAEGTLWVRPTKTTNYVLLAKADQRTASASIVLRVLTSFPNARNASDSPSDSQMPELQDLYFSSDRTELTEAARRALVSYVEHLKRILQSTPDSGILLEGHCDDQGSSEYSLGIAARRAAVVLGDLSLLGVPTNRVEALTVGSEQPLCAEASVDCRARNNRVHLSVTSMARGLELPPRR